MMEMEKKHELEVCDAVFTVHVHWIQFLACGAEESADELSCEVAWGARADVWEAAADLHAADWHDARTPGACEAGAGPVAGRTAGTAATTARHTAGHWAEVAWTVTNYHGAESVGTWAVRTRARTDAGHSTFSTIFLGEYWRHGL